MNKIDENIKRHDKIYKLYGSRHTEIYNHIEQTRLLEALKSAKKNIRTKSKRLRALDYGCGDGNLTKHLLDLSIDVTAADVTEKFLSLISDRYPYSNCQTLLINGNDLSNIKDASYDMVATYSVLHHIPDYIHIIKEFCRVLKPGGVLYIDHERADEFWKPSPEYQLVTEFVQLKQNHVRRLTKSNLIPRAKRKARYYLDPRKVYNDKKNNLAKKLNPRFQEEGDIHVFPDDHIEWNKIISTLRRNNLEVVSDSKFLLYDPKLYTVDEYNIFSNLCFDERCITAIKS